MPLSPWGIRQDARLSTGYGEREAAVERPGERPSFDGLWRQGEGNLPASL